MSRRLATSSPFRRPADNASRGSGDILAFGSFELICSQRMLMSGGERIQVGDRAIDILISLVLHAGDMISKRELMATAWPHSFVEESNLRVHIASLRKILDREDVGRRFIDNVAGRGYVFVAAVETRASLTQQRTLGAASSVGQTHLVGRNEIVADIVRHVAERRLVTIVGPAGVGKSAVAMAVRQEMLARELVWLVDLAAVIRPDLLPAALAAVLGVSVSAEDPLGNIVEFLRAQPRTVIFDNCEHLVDPLATMIEQLFKRVAGLKVLATSREPLEDRFEFVVRLKPLDVPHEFSGLTAERALAFASVRLFVERASSSSGGFQITDENAGAVAEVCAKFDGIPLAIELIAARADLFGIKTLSTMLGQRLLLFASDSRSLSPRGRSLREVFEWSYELLSTTEKTVLRCLSIFRGSFPLESAVALAVSDDASAEDVIDALASLCHKSLIAVDIRRSLTRYRLLNVTRTFAAEKASATGATGDLARRHCDHLCELLTSAEHEWETLTRPEWLEAYGHAIDDVRAALDWGFSPEGSLSTAVTLMVAALPFGFQLYLLDEFRRRAEHALRGIGETNPLAALRLSSALCSLELNASTDGANVKLAFERIARLSGRISDSRFRVEPLLVRVVYQIENGAFEEGLASLRALALEARGQNDPLAILATDRIRAQATHFAGRHSEARALAERVIRHPAKVIPLVYSQATIDHRLSMRIVIARSLWIEGRIDDSRALMRECMEAAARDGPLPMAFAAGMGGCLISLWLGDLDTAAKDVGSLLSTSARYTLPRWGRLGEGYAAALRRVREPSMAVDALDFSFPAPVSTMHQTFLATVGLDTLDAPLLAAAEGDRCGWCQPEIVRLGALRAFRNGASRSEAVHGFRRSIDIAQAQGALSWELRAATSLAEFLRDDGTREQARAILDATCAKFLFGTDAADFRRAQAALADLR